MGISDKIEQFITELLKQEGNDWLELKRNEMASIFGCVPSQINYVLSTRFNPERGYLIESRRGGGGFIRIRRVYLDNKSSILNMLYQYNSVDEGTAYSIVEKLFSNSQINSKEKNIMLCCVSDKVLSNIKNNKDRVRLDILRAMISAISN